MSSKLQVDGALWIAGESVAGSGGPAIPVLSPATGQECGRVDDASADDALAAVTAAHDALASWRKVPPRDRAEVLRRCFDLMTERAEQIARMISLENGKILADARAEVSYAAEFFRWYSEEAVRCVGQVSTAPSGTNKIIVQYQPIGVAVLVTPWNFPAAMATRKIAPALAAGSTVVLKPATETPLTAHLIASLCADAGVPDGVVNVITTRRARDVVSTLLRDPRVRALSFTGSTEVGRDLLRSAADQVLKCSMELGGNAPFIVFEDADLDAAIDGLMVAKMRNGGQACTAANRILAHADIAADLAQRLAERMGNMRVGPSLDAATECGPLINDSAVEGVHALVSDARLRGAELLTGGKILGGVGSYYPPTVLTGVPVDAQIASAEIFGPVASIMVFDDEEQAITVANGTEYGLAAYVYTSDVGRGMRVAEALDFGMVGINRGLVSDAAAPFGGVKQSGLGREGGREGMLEFMEAKYIAVDW